MHGHGLKLSLDVIAVVAAVVTALATVIATVRRR